MRIKLISNIATENESQQRAGKFLKAGQLSRAYKCVVSNQSRLEPNAEVYQALRDKYPAERLHCLTNTQLDDMNSFRFDANNLKPSITVDSLGKIANMIAHGFDHFRFEHL